ncbi:MAG: HAD family hydrolase [Gammaproteobacteria bacterium]|nr:HAD family hydrolase [Gammaproteobacteria bacterium]
MPLALFDLDNTLLAGDSDYLWGEFLVERGVVDRHHYARENERFYHEYQAGTLDIHAWLAFQLRPLAEHEPGFMLDLRRQFLEEKIRPIILPAGRALIEHHRTRGDTPLIITATNSFITRPIAASLGIEYLLATEPEIVAGRYTGGVTGIPCFRNGKVDRLSAWLTENRKDLAGSWFYSDSHNDLPLLQLVEHPVAVNPDDTLARYAASRSWPILDLR